MSLEAELHTQQVTHLELSGFCQAPVGTPVREVLAKMRQEKQNVCLVVDGDTLVGIFTERDVLGKVVAAPETLDNPVEAVMTHQPVTVPPSLSAAEALKLMDERHFRNLPVVTDQGEIVGSMTHQAIIAYLAARYPVEVLNRPPRPDQFPRKAEGG